MTSRFENADERRNRSGRRLVRDALGVLAAWIAALSATPAMANCVIGEAGATVRVDVPGTERSVLLHVPAQSTHKPRPLVFLLHGSGGTGEQMLARSGLTETAERHGFLIVAPDAGLAAYAGFAWNIPGVPTVTGQIPTDEDPDDVAFIAQTSDWLTRSGCADSRRVYVTGHSGGGRMSSWLGCVAADRFAAIAPVVGLRAGNPSADDPQKPDPATCQPTRAMPVLAFAGDADEVNPVEGGGAPYWQYPMATALARWAVIDGCDRGPQEVALSGGRSEQRYTKCRNGTEVTGHIVAGAGHDWVADNEAMWAFFARHHR